MAPECEKPKFIFANFFTEVVVWVSTVVICIFMRGRGLICISMDIANLHIHEGRDLICISLNINKGAVYR